MGNGTPIPLSGEIAFEVVELDAAWRLAAVDGVVTPEEERGLWVIWERLRHDVGLLAETVDLIATAARGQRGVESRAFVDKITPLKRRRKQLEVVWASDERDAA
jgi:hypothetical protein